MPEQSTEKACVRCGEVKPLTDFYRAPKCRDGRRRYCKTCHNAPDKARAAAEREKRWGEGGDYIVDESGCWIWQRYINRHGYGRLARGGKRGTPRQLAHRWYYERLVGPIPDGLELDHLCRNRACVNPDHLEPVTMPAS
jgi:hypothetical protein